MANLTLVLCTIRENPRFDLMLQSLANAVDNMHTREEIDFILIDGWPNRDKSEYNAIDEALNELDIEFIVSEVKPSPWQGAQRLTKQDYNDLCGARNTALILARTGDHIVFFDDCSLLDEDFLNRHYVAAERKLAMCGSFMSVSGAIVKDGVLVSFDKDHGPDQRAVQTGNQMTLCPGNWLWGLNFSFPLDMAVKINGFDEMYSGQAGSEDCDFGERLKRAGCKTVFDPTCLVIQMLDTHQEVCPLPEGKKQKERTLRTGRVAYANEFLIQELVEDYMRYLARHTPDGPYFDLASARELWQTKGIMQGKSWIETDWRDGQKLEEM